MKRNLLVGIGVIIIFGAIFIGVKNFGSGRDGVAPQSLGKISSDKVGRGKYLAQVADCVACHTQKGGALFAGGAPLSTPFGTISGGNITPDRETGIGTWTDQDFLNAVKQGRAKSGRFLYPAMPYPNFAKASDDDILAIKAYLDTVPAIKQKNNSNRLIFPFNIRLLVLGWNTLFFDKDGFQPDPSKSDEWNRGAYLTEALAHCGMCHTPKNMLGADKADEAFQGALLGGWYAPELTSSKYSGIGSWTQKQGVEYLQSGSTRHAFASGPMAEAIDNSLQHLNDEDLAAIIAYLQSQPGSNNKAPEKPLEATMPIMMDGSKLFSSHCSACHGIQGEGTYGIAPAFSGSSAINTRDPINLVTTILDGGRTVATHKKVTASAMPSFRQMLSDEEIASVITYIRNSWGNSGDVVTAATVSNLRQHQKTTPKPEANN